MGELEIQQGEQGVNPLRKIVLLVAMSLDGYIADSSSSGGGAWLNGQGNDDEEKVDTYSRFVKSIDTVLMGWNTYHQVA